MLTRWTNFILTALGVVFILFLQLIVPIITFTLMVTVVTCEKLLNVLNDYYYKIIKNKKNIEI